MRLNPPSARECAHALAASAGAGLLGWAITESVDFPLVRGVYTAVLAVLIVRDTLTRHLRWLAVRNLLTNPISVQDLALTPNPNAFLVEWLKRRDAARAIELLRGVMVPALVIAVFGGFAEGPGSGDFRVRLAVACAGTLALTRIAFHRLLRELGEVELLGAPPILAQMALRRIRNEMGRDPSVLKDLHPVAHSPVLLLVAGAMVGVLLYLDTASDATALAALVVLPAVFPLYVFMSRPRTAETALIAENATGRMLTVLARSEVLADRAKPLRQLDAHS